MLTNRDEYTRLLEAYIGGQEAAKHGITREYAAMMIGESIYHDLSILASSPAHSYLVGDFFSSLRDKKTVAIHDIIDELLKRTAGVSLQRAEHVPSEHIYDIHQKLSDLFDKPIIAPAGVRVDKDTLSRLNAYLNELKELQDRIIPLYKYIDPYREYKRLARKGEMGIVSPEEVETKKRLRESLDSAGVFDQIEEIENDFAKIAAKYSDINSTLGIYSTADDPVTMINDVRHKVSTARRELYKEYKLFNDVLNAAIGENKAVIAEAGVKGLESIFTSASLSETNRMADKVKRLRERAIANIRRTIDRIIEGQHLVGGLAERLYGSAEAFEEILGGRVLSVAGGDARLFIAGEATGISGADAVRFMQTYQRQVKRYQSVMRTAKRYDITIPSILHGEVTGTPGKVRSSIESTKGIDNLRSYTVKISMQDIEDTVEAVSKWRTETGGMEAVRANIGSQFAEKLDQSYRVYKTGQESAIKEYKVADHTAEWEAMKIGESPRPLRVPGSAVPYEVVSVNPERKTVTIKPASISARDISASIRLAANINTSKFNQILSASKEISQLAKEIEFAAKSGTLTKATERVAGIIAGNVQVADINRIISSAASSDRGLPDILYEIAKAHVPWAAGQIEKDELANMSMLATYEAVKAHPGNIVIGKEGLSADVLRGILENDVAKRTYERTLLDEVFKVLNPAGDYNSIVKLISYIKENMLVQEAPQKYRGLTDMEAVRLLKDAAEKVLDKDAENTASAMHHLKHISNMNTAEILGEITKSPEASVSPTNTEPARAGRQSLAEIERMVTNASTVNDFIRKHRDLIKNLEASGDVGEARQIMDELAGKFTAETGLGRGELMTALKARLGGGLVPGVEYSIDLSGLDESTALRRIKSLLSLRRKLGGALEVDFFAGKDKQPITVSRGTHDIIAVNRLTNRRYVVGPARAVTETTAVKPLDLSDFFEKYENRVLEEIKGVAADKLAIVRSPGVNFKDLITLRSGGKEFYLGDIPDISLSVLHRLRTMKLGSSMVLIGFDWETTTLPGSNLPFYPTEVGFIVERLSREPSGRFVRENLISENILFKPSQEVAQALEKTIDEITAGGIRNKVSIKAEQFHFLRNIAKFADNEILRLTSAREIDGRVELDGKIARRLMSAARSGFEHLSEHGLEFDESLARLTELMRQARKAGGNNAILFGQNILQAEYEWSKIFARMAQTPKVQMKFSREVEKLFNLPRAELMILDKFMQMGRRTPGTAEAQVERYIKPILQAGSNASISTTGIIRELGITGDVTHRGLEDIKTELGVLYSHLGRELSATADLRPVRIGGYVARHKVSRVGGAYSTAEEGRPVRDVFKYKGIIEDNGRYRIVLNRVELDESGKLIETGAMEFVHAPSMLELARRFHEQYEYLPGEKAAWQVYNELVEDYARREVLKAVKQPDKLGEFVTWPKYGLPVFQTEEGFEERPVVKLSREYVAARDKLESGKALTPAEELLFGATYERPRDTSAYSRPALGSAELIEEELSGARVGRLRRRAWPYVKRWLESHEGSAYGKILEETARFRAIGLMDMPGGEMMKQVEEVRKGFIASHGLTPATAERRGIYSLGKPEIPGVEAEEIIVTASSPERIERRIDRFLTKAAEKAGKTKNEIFVHFASHLERTGISTAGVVSLPELSTKLYQAALEGKLPSVRVEARHVPVINTPELSDEFVEMVRRRVIFPNLRNVGEEEAGTITGEEVERRIAGHPILAARAEKYRRAIDELEEKGLSGLHLRQAANMPVLTADIPGEELVFDDTGLKSPELVEQLYNRVKQIREQTGGRIRMGNLRHEHGLNDLINTLSRRLRAEMYAPTQPQEAWSALGWPSGEEVITQDAIIPVPGPPELEHDIYMRRLGEFDIDELKKISSVLQGESSAVARRTGRMIEQHVRGQEQLKPLPVSAEGPVPPAPDGAELVRGAAGNSVRDMNEAIKEEAAKRGAGGAKDKIGTRNINEAIKEEATRRRFEAGKSRTFRSDLEAIGRGIAHNWKLIAGLGLAGLGLSIILKPRDRDGITSEDNRAYTESKKGPALRMPAEEAYPKARAIPMEEKGAPGLRIKVRGRSRGGVDHNTVSNAVGATVNDTLGINTNINISTQDNRRAVNEQSIKDMFSKLLRYGYIS